MRDRHDAVEELSKSERYLILFRREMKGIFDLERYLVKIYKYSVESENRAIYIDVNVIDRLNEFFKCIQQFEQIIDKLDIIFENKSKLKSRRLRHLVNFKNLPKKKKTKSANPFWQDSDSEDIDESQVSDLEKDDDKNLLPDIRYYLNLFNSLIYWKKISNSKRLAEPIPGLSKEFDEANDRVEQIKARLNSLLEITQKKLKCEELKYSTSSKRYRFQFEIPNKMAKKIPNEYENTSKTSNVKRYQNNELRLIVGELEEAEESLREALTPFISKLFKKFYKKQHLWSTFLAWIAELDWLMALANVSRNEKGMIKPQIVEIGEKVNGPCLEIIGLRHPWVEKTVKEFVPNNVIIGDSEPLVHLITGPNMGGKSTLLRQTCISVILCQIGCFVPAKSWRMTLVDRIFTRIGANDRIIENKSTFFVEMEETKTIIEQATSNSLVIMDELGRGTSTFDGYSIAHAVLSYHVKHNRCRTLFTTHYHMLVDAFKSNLDVQPMKMHCTIDPISEEISFLYTYTKGYTLQSEGISVAKMASVPQCILDAAKAKSDTFKAKLKQLEGKILADCQ